MGGRLPSGWDGPGYASFHRFLETVGSSSDAELVRRDGVLAMVAPAAPDRSLFNGVLYESPPQLERCLEELTEIYDRAGVRAWTVWVPHEDEGSSRALAEGGHSLDASPRQMTIDLASMPDPDDELKLTKTIPWRKLCSINDAAYELEPGTFERGLGARPPAKLHAYGAHHGGFLASALATLDHEGDCFIGLVATLPEARGKGLAGSLLHRALIDARGRGCSSSSLQASRSGVPVYARLGYRDLGRLDMWERRLGAGS